MTDCSSLQGSTSSSSDAMSSRGGSNNSAASGGNGNPRIRIIRMIRPNARRIVLGPENSIGFGFAIRGGKEYGTGFFVSKVDKGSEADLRGLRIGDQIIRVNGYHVEDAVHRELTQFISYQDRLTLKVRGVGMLPIKEKTLDPLTWHIVPRHALATTLTALDEQMNTIGKDVRIVLKVAPKTKLGLGICKGPEWKPGIFVQFTKEFSVARESGLRPGDQILTCNSIDFSDVLFSEAVAVMKSSNILEMIVRTGAGLDLFPGESSGYNSSASSITGDQSPCWADQSAKRLSMVREEPTISQTKNQWSMDGNKCNLDRRKTITGIPNSALNQIMYSRNNSTTGETTTTTTTTADETNKTIIQLSDNGTLINNTIVSNPSLSNFTTINNNLNNYRDISNTNNGHLSSTSMSTFISPDFNNSTTTGNLILEQQENDSLDYNNDNEKSNNNNKIADICFVSRQSETKTVIVEVHRSDNDENLQLNTTNFGGQKLQQLNQGKYNNYIENNILNNKNNNSGQPIYGKIQRNKNNNNNTNICPKPPPLIMNMTIPPPPPPALSNNSINSKSISGSPLPTIKSTSLYNTIDSISSRIPSSSSVMSNITNNGHHHNHHHERSPSVASSITSSGGTSLSSAISEELKKRKERLSQNPNQKLSIDESVANSKQQQQQQQSKRFGNPSLGGNDARHTALMDEFKRAHRRMFRNDSNETETERQEELKKTTIMRDETDHRSPAPPPPPKIVTNHKSNCAMLNSNVNNVQPQNGHHHNHHQHHHHHNNTSAVENVINGMNGSKTEYNENHTGMNGNGQLNGNSNGINGTNGQFPTPPPPPQFANKTPMGKKIFASINAFNAANGLNNTNNNGNNQNGHNELQRTTSQNLYNTTTMTTTNNNNDIPPNVPPPPPPPLPQSPIPDYESILSESPVNTLTKHNQYKHSNGCSSNMSTLGRVAASEIAKANGDMAELESIDSYQMLNPSSPSPKPPSAYFIPPNSGPPTMKKSNRPVSVTIGEYGASKPGGRKEPGKFDFISSRSGSNSPNDLGSPMSPISPGLMGKDENVSHMLRSELELTLSRSNLKKRHDFNVMNNNNNISNNNNNNNNGTIVQYNNGVYQNGSFQHTNNNFESNHNIDHFNNGLQQNGCTKIQNGTNNNNNSPISSNNRNVAYQSSNNNNFISTTQQQLNFKQPPLSSNVEKITNMLQNMNNGNGNGNGTIYETSATFNGNNNNNNNNNNTIDKNYNINGANNSSTTRVTISLPNNITSSKIELRKTDSNNSTSGTTTILTTPTNGILKNSMNSMINGGANGGNRNNFNDKSITFGN